MIKLDSDRSFYFILASILTLFLLLYIQVYWLKQSKAFIEQQFDNKVSMALCGAVEDFSNSNVGISVQSECSNSTQGGACCSDQLIQYVKDPEMEESIREALAFYDIHLDFKLKVIDDHPTTIPDIRLVDEEPIKSNGCYLNPLNAGYHYLEIIFPDKGVYVLKKMGLMLFLSVFFILVLSGVLLYGYRLIRKQKEMAERNKEFFNLMAHEFKTPLTNIGLAANMLEKKINDPLLSIVKNENKQLSQEVERILSIASMENGQFQIQKSKIELNGMIRKIIDIMQVQAVDYNGTITFAAHKSEIFISGDAHHLSNAVKNLIENALKYNDRDPVIHISLEVSDGMVHLKVMDNGVGVSKEDQAIIFEKFYRVYKGDLYTKKGFGLGLAYVKKIVDLHSGVIEVISELTHGTRFNISLPVFNQDYQ